MRLIAAFLIVALVGWVGVVSAQQTPAPAPTPAAPAAPPPAMVEKTMDGTVNAVDQAKKQITLEDGTLFTIPTTVRVSWAELKPGTPVAVSYTEPGKAVKKVEVKN